MGGALADFKVEPQSPQVYRKPRLHVPKALEKGKG